MRQQVTILVIVMLSCRLLPTATAFGLPTLPNHPQPSALVMVGTTTSGFTTQSLEVDPPSLLSTTLAVSVLSNPRDSADSLPATVNNNNEQQQLLVLDKSVTKKWTNDAVVRVTDGNTIKLEQSGLVSLAAIQTPSGYSGDFPDCMTYTPSYKVKQLLPAKTKVKILLLDSSSGASKTPPRALMVRHSDDKFINAALVQSGFAKPSPRGREQAEVVLPGLTEQLKRLAANAKRDKVGMYQTCDAQLALQQEFAPEAQFEPLELTVETEYYSDGGKQVLKKAEPASSSAPPENPGDSRGCSDFDTYEEALQWFDRYRPYYGDVAKLDKDNDGIPCPGLPHTQNQDRYRMKVPDATKRQQ